MESLFLILLGITGLFFIFLIIKSIFKKREFCVICASVSTTWIFLIILYFLGNFSDKVLIALLIGQSIAGIFYLLESKTSDNLKIFRLPFILTLLALVYFVLQKFDIGSMVFILVLWGIFIVIYLFREHEGFNTLVNKLIACCKGW
ncbi:MAG: hypothetical protein NUV97_02115 [archaeon]|nr:hypothetical protein [archaeon]MCR4323746.1 hypothetical protein [Nanoarchaeota archaeon]